MTGASGIPGGIANFNLNKLHALVSLAQERRIELTVLSFLENNTDRPDFLPDWVNFKAFEGNKLKLSFNLLRYAIKKPLFCFDHVTLALPLLPLVVTGIVKTVIFANGSEAWRGMRQTSQFLFKHATLCLAISEFILSKMKERIPQFNGKVCLLGLSPEFPLNQELPLASSNPIEIQSTDGQKYRLGDRVLLLVARMDSAERQKGHYALLKILPILLQEYPDVQLVFPGPGEDRMNLEQLAHRLGVASSVFFPGYISVQMLESLYQHCYAFVMPSKQEGFGLVYLEAMNYGKPCVGCFDDAAEEVIVHRQTGLLVRDPKQPEQLLDVLYTLLQNPAQAKIMGRNGFERLHSYFTSQQVQERIKLHIATVL